VQKRIPPIARYLFPPQAQHFSPFPPASSALFSPVRHFPKIETIETIWNTRDVLSTALTIMKETLRWQFFSSSAQVARKTAVSALWFSQRFTFQYYWRTHARRF
jgi:hypothetical protein